LVSVPTGSTPEKDQAAKAKADKIYQEIKKGESFEKLAKKYSDDSKTSQKGGELAWISQSETASDFEKAAFALEKPGQVSEPVRTDSGYDIIKLIEKQADKVQPLAEVKAQVLQKYKSQVAQEKFYHMIDEISVIAYEQPDSLQPIVEKYQLPLKKTDYFSQKNPPTVPELLNTSIMTVAFSQPVKEDRNNSELIQLNEESYIVLRVSDLKPSKQKPFAEVKEVVKQRLLNEKMDELVKAAAEKLLAEIKAGKGDKISLNWQDHSKITRSNKELSPIIVEAVFSLPKPQKPSDKIATLSRLENGDYAIIWLARVQDGDGSKLSIQEKQSYQSSLANIHGELEFALYSTELAREANVKKYVERI
jgi:peptidyl-prolyl cis-trans isomerase D